MSITAHSADFRRTIDRLLIRIPESRKVLPMESKILDFGIEN